VTNPVSLPFSYFLLDIPVLYVYDVYIYIYNILEIEKFKWCPILELLSINVVGNFFYFIA